MTKRRYAMLWLLGGVLGAPAHGAPAATGAVEVISVIGPVRSEGKPLVAGDRLRAGAEVELGASATAQLLLGRRLAVGLCDGIRVRLLRAGTDVTILNRGTARLAGRGTVAVGGIALKSQGTVVVRRGTLHVLAGQARAEPGGRVVGAGHAARLGPKGRLLVSRGRIEPAVSRRTLRYQPPPPWDPAEGRVEITKQVRRAQQRVHQERERERELATCGCTESSGSAGTSVDKGPTSSAIEGRGGRVRVQIRGMPRKLP